MTRPKRQPARRRPEDPNVLVLPKLREHYSDKAIEHMLHPRNMRRLEQPTGYARVDTGHDEQLEIFLELDQETVTACAFQTNGCAATLACASAVTELAVGKTIREILSEVTTEAILRALEGLPPGNIHCAGLAADAVRTALADAMSQSHQPWKKLYRRI